MSSSRLALSRISARPNAASTASTSAPRTIGWSSAIRILSILPSFSDVPSTATVTEFPPAGKRKPLEIIHLDRDARIFRVMTSTENYDQRRTGGTLHPTAPSHRSGSPWPERHSIEESNNALVEAEDHRSGSRSRNQRLRLRSRRLTIPSRRRPV